jgi:hypothetical protein
MKRCKICKHHEANAAAATCPKCGEGTWETIAAPSPVAEPEPEATPVAPAQSITERRRRRL